MLSGEGAKAELPIVESSVGSDGYDIRNLLRTTGNVTYDMGFANTASCQSAITYIDGEKGVLRYRGYPIEQLADKSTFLETAYLVIYGELPRPAELADFEERIKRKTIIDEGMRKFFETFPRGSHPMPVLAAGVQALGTFSTTSIGDDPQSIEKATERLIAKMPTLAAYGYKNSRGEPFLYPDNALSYVQNFERMSFGYPTEPYHFEPEITRALDVLLILHADHEQNCSSSTVRLVGSSGANIYASISAGINALSGPLHGGANQAVLEMLEAIKASGISVKEYVQQVKDRNAGIKLMGFGHRIYKNYDRARPSSSSTPIGCSPSNRGAATYSTSPRNWSRRRWLTTTSPSASSIRTSTSIRASSMRRWAFPRRCSRCCSRSGACPAGSPSGASSVPTRTQGSGVRVRCTPGYPSATMCPWTIGRSSGPERVARSVDRPVLRKMHDR
ncbi:Citrate (Si)-synthase [Propionibacterium freudenreichii]|nr:Citrate (Si)-synthase [Propionibacterium freudenreichii]